VRVVAESLLNAIAECVRPDALRGGVADRTKIPNGIVLGAAYAGEPPNAVVDVGQHTRGRVGHLGLLPRPVKLIASRIGLAIYHLRHRGEAIASVIAIALGVKTPDAHR